MKKTIYIVEYHEWDCHEEYGVFFSLQKARKAMRTAIELGKQDKHRQFFGIVRTEIDQFCPSGVFEPVS